MAAGMNEFERLPDKRHSIRGVDLDGATVWLSHSVATKLYRCPGCRQSLLIGTEHVLVRVVPVGGDARHQHWHTECARAIVLRGLRAVDTRRAEEAAGTRPRPGKGARRAAALRRRTDRER